MVTLSYSDHFSTTQGQLVRVRRIMPEDTPFLVDIFDHMSSASRYQRFNQTVDSLAPKRIWTEALQIAQADPAKNNGLIAFVDLPQKQSMPVGAVRYVETRPTEAEVAISIRDDFQNVGIGKQIMRLLAFEASAQGYQQLTALIRNDNPAIWKVFASLPFKVTRSPEGSYSQVDIWLNHPTDLEIGNIQAN